MSYFKTFVLWGLLSAAFVWGGSVSLTRGAEPRRLTFNGRLKMDPVFFSQGKEIAYVEQEKFNLLSLMRLNLADGSSKRLHPSATASQFSPSFSADGRFYAYLKNTGNLHVNLVIRNVGNGIEVEHNPGGGFAGIRNLTMAPAGDRVLFAFADGEGTQQIFSLDIKGEKRYALTQKEAHDASPRFSADGRRVAFSSTRDGNFDIFVMDSKGGHINPLTKHKSLDVRPAWSPDGKQIAFSSLRDGNYEIYVMDADGSNLRRATNHPERDDFACWHPDGKQLVVVGERKGSHDLYLIDVPK